METIQIQKIYNEQLVQLKHSLSLKIYVLRPGFMLRLENKVAIHGQYIRPK